jgi:beta-lactamase regulating signal transducer with metallopeptidase domain
MDTLRVVDHPLVATLGWTLTHFVWQGAVLGLAAFFLLRVVRPAHASTRYLIGAATLAAMMLAPLGTFVASSGLSSASQRGQSASMPLALSQAGMVTGAIVAGDPTIVHQLSPATPGAGSARAARAGEDVGAGIVRDRGSIAPVWLPLVTAAWMAGVLVLSLRMLGGWVMTVMLARRAVAAVSEQVETAAREMAHRLRLRREFAVLQSAAVAVPTLVGWVKPVVLLPASALTGLSEQQLRAVLAHELAHILRHDYLVNLLQTAVETLLFYHPAVWWVSAEVRAEREHCCDDLAVDVCGDRLVYVSALAELTSLQRRAFALAATDGSLVTRVRRILGRPVDARPELPPSWAVLVLLVLIGGGAGTYEMSADARDVAEVAQAAAAPAFASGDGAQSRWSPWPAPMPPEPPEPPEAPVAPAAPATPAAPAVPAAPAPPDAPAAPAPPSSPLAPVGPVGAVAPVAPVAPTAPVAPSAPAAPVAPVAPIAPVPPAQRDSGNFVWNNNRERLAVRWTGQFRLSDDERDIAWVQEGATVTISDGWVFTDRVELRGVPGGQVARTFYRSGVERPFEVEAQAFLSTAVQRMIRAGMFATERVTRLLKQGGVDAVLADVERLQTDSSHVRRVYYSALIDQADLTSAQLAQLLDRVRSSMTSDHERGVLLAQVLRERSITDEQRVLVARVAGALKSDHEQRRVLTAVVDVASLSPALVTAVLDAARTVDSSHERSMVLRVLAEKGGVTGQTSKQFMDAVTTMTSSHEQRQVLAVVAAESGAAKGVAAPVIVAAGSISSSHEKSQVLLDLIAKGAVIDDTATAFFPAVDSITSPYERSRVLKALVARPSLSDRLLLGVLESSTGISASHERATLLLAVVKTHTLTGAARTAFIDAAEGISAAHERNQVLATLVRSERQ